MPRRSAPSAAPQDGRRSAAGTRTLELTPAAALTFYLDVDITIKVAGRLAQAVADAGSLEEANDALNVLGVGTELDYEREAAGVPRRAQPAGRLNADA